MNSSIVTGSNLTINREIISPLINVTDNRTVRVNNTLENIDIGNI